MRPTRVVIAGGGFAALEALHALRELADDRVEVTLVSDRGELAYRPLSVFAAAGGSDVPRWSVRELAEAAGARMRLDRVEAVAGRARRVRLASGGALEYDELVLALGARARAAVPGALTFRDQRDAPALHHGLERVVAGHGRMVLCAPAGVTWTLPLYEMALIAAQDLRTHGSAATITVVTPERAPVEVFGRAGSAALAELLVERGVRLVHREQPVGVEGRGLRLRDGGVLPADLVVASPRLVAPRLSGVPGDYNGLVPTDEAGRVKGARSMYAIGDMTSYPVKQGGIATQQADDVARTIAIAAGAPAPPPNGLRVLRGRVAGADPPLTLRVELDRHGRPADDGLAVWGPEPLWWPPAKVFGRYLAPHLAVDRAGAAVLSSSPQGAADLSPAKA